MWKHVGPGPDRCRPSLLSGSACSLRRFAVRGREGPPGLPPARPELLEKDICCEKSDVYSLGRVLCRIAHICGSQNMWMLGRVCRVRGLEDRLDLTTVLYFLRQVQASRGGWTSHGVEQGAYRSVKDKISSMIFNLIVSIKNHFYNLCLMIFEWATVCLLNCAFQTIITSIRHLPFW